MIGVTGGIGSGKSVICRIVCTLGYPVFYSDNEAKRILIENGNIRQKVISVFGEEVYSDSGLNRPFLSQKIFSEPSLKEKLENIIHPAVRDEFERWGQLQESPLLFNEAAILFETGGYKSYNYTILVTSPLELRLDRIMKRDGLDRPKVQKRFENQWSDEKKETLASFVISNDEESMLIPQVLEAINKIREVENI